MIQETIFTCHDLEENTQAMADFLPNGKLFIAKNLNDSLYRQFLRGLSHTTQDAEALLCLMDSELNIQTGSAYIDEWEKTVGIPDGCFSTNESIEVRRQQILIKLAALGVQTELDFINLALLFGVVITIEHGITYGAFTYTFPMVFFPDLRAARFTMIVRYAVTEAYEFTYTYPIHFGNNVTNIIECLFRRLVPANVDLLFWNTDPAPIPPPPPTEFNLDFNDDFA